ncbi:PREDICTED: uncharacterized protein LOC105573993 isoform X1 [Cercocebus atys]|uniref:uncharacterized protein LOC105573993 isoform X1 n=1 Tax=Cercocebus atys TaxID=9531 RepID=UPI0005F45C2C|nr:PREDICTED: uncharacterized protein LOC105573993 isoform X1 [Cercocebus atys]
MLRRVQGRRQVAAAPLRRPPHAPLPGAHLFPPAGGARGSRGGAHAPKRRLFGGRERCAPFPVGARAPAPGVGATHGPYSEPWGRETATEALQPHRGRDHQTRAGLVSAPPSSRRGVCGGAAERRGLTRRDAAIRQDPEREAGPGRWPEEDKRLSHRTEVMWTTAETQPHLNKRPGPGDMAAASAPSVLLAAARNWWRHCLSPLLLPRVSLHRPGWSAAALSEITTISATQIQAIILPQPPE